MVLFNEVAAYQLRDRGRLDLDASVCRYVRSCPARWQSITPIAFSGELGAITASSADGSGRVALTRPYAGRGFPVAWSPDGRRVLFNRFDRGAAFVVDADGLNERRVSRGAALAWTRDGSVVVARGGRIWIVSANGASRRRATAPGLRNAPMALSFSPDGRRLVWTRPAGRLGPRLRSRIFLTDLQTGATRPLRSEPGFYLISADAWSPDGMSIAFTRRAAVGSFEGGLYVTDAEGGTLRRLSRDAGQAPSWSPDGRMLAYNVGISCQLRIVSVDSAAGVTLPFEGCRPVWRP
jgi:Tol biopolymer transport system component